MQNPAFSNAIAIRRSNPDANLVQALIAFSLLVAVLVWLRQPTVGLGMWAFDSIFESAPTSSLARYIPRPADASVTPPKQFQIKFVPPSYLDTEQLENIETARLAITNPAAVGLSDKVALDLPPDAVEVYLSLLGYENHYRHTDEQGNVVYSYSGCCVGIAQVHLETSVCEQWELFILERNLWCGARIFANYYHEWLPKAGPEVNKIAVAMYKNAVLMNEDLTAFVPDQNGLPIIGPDDPNNPMDFASQVATVFIDPYTGASRFSFTVLG